MKILIVQDYLRSGGTERQSVLLANAFAANGHACSLLTFRPGGALRSTIKGAVRQVSLQPIDTKMDWFAPGLVRTARSIDPDVILCMGRMANCYGRRLKEALPKTRVIASMRTGKRLPWLFRRSLKSVTHVIANSRDAQSTLVNSYRVDPAKIRVIYNSLVFPETVTRELAHRTLHGATEKTTVLLCVAMFRPEKNQRELVEIVGGLPPDVDWQLWLTGDGPARAECEQLVVRKQLTKKIIFPGFVRDPSALYAAADVAVHASASESLSNFLIEAQAHGLPAVAYQAQGIEETFVPGQTGWAIPRSDRDAFRQRLVSLVSEPNLTKQSRSEAARDFARATFDPAIQVFQYLDLFARLMSTKR